MPAPQITFRLPLEPELCAKDYMAKPLTLGQPGKTVGEIVDARVENGWVVLTARIDDVTCYKKLMGEA